MDDDDVAVALSKIKYDVLLLPKDPFDIYDFNEEPRLGTFQHTVRLGSLLKIIACLDM